VASRDALVRHPLSIAGALITTVSAVVFIALAIAALAGWLENPYVGLVVFILLPALFVVGLLLIPLGMRLQRRKIAADPNASVEWPVLDFRRPELRKTTLLVVALSAVNLVILLVAGYGSLHWMESPSFCGQVCHTPMQPQHTAWQQADHARVACVSCHIGEGAGAFVHAKLAGVRQLAHVVTGSYPRPVPPGAEMPAGAQAQTCLGCHQPSRVVGDQVRAFYEYAEDDQNTETRTLMRMHVGAGSLSGHAIHTHADPAIRIEYVASDTTRQTIPYVKFTDAKGQVKEYFAEGATEQTIGGGTRRTMDCVDCHNTVGHPIAPTAENAVDHAIAAGQVSRKLPFARREGVRLLKASYDSQDAAAAEIERGFRGFYQSTGGSIDQHELARTVTALQNLYLRNVFPTMKVTWGTYPHNVGHPEDRGCFRCHDDNHKAKDSSTISGDCEYCHKEIEQPE
jgi:nitrate/TMAO reductase-like tetraheme cytochrome c subunit